MGQVACGMAFPEATLIRDFTSNVYSGDYLGAAMNIGGTKYAGKLFTVLKDSSLVTAFVKKVGPTEPKIGTELMDTLREQGIYRTELPAADKVGVLDKAFGGAATRLSGQGVSDEVIAEIYEHNGDITRTLEAGKREDSATVWIEEGKLVNAQNTELGTVYDKGGSGWIHIRNNHILYNKINQFEGAFGETYTDENNIKELIMQGAKYGQKINNNGVYHYIEPNSGKTLELVIGDNGYIVTAHPI